MKSVRYECFITMFLYIESLYLFYQIRGINKSITLQNRIYGSKDFNSIFPFIFQVSPLVAVKRVGYCVEILITLRNKKLLDVQSDLPRVSLFLCNV